MPMQDHVRLGRGIWVPVGAEDDLGVVCLAVLRECSDDAVIAKATAARLHELWLPPELDGLHVATAAPERAGRSMTRTKRPEFRAHRLQLAVDERTVVRGVPVTSLARTWRDLASMLDVPSLVAAGDRALQCGVTREELAAAITRGRFRGKLRALAALPLLDERSRSRPESHMRVAISTPALPRFAVNEAVFRDSGGWLAEPDLSLVEAKLALEYQGEHHAGVLRMRKDITRFVDMRAEGWLCLAYGPAETFKRPWLIEAEVRGAVAERASHLLRRRVAG